MIRGISAVMAVLLAAAVAQAASVTVTQIKASGSGGQVTVDPRLSDIKESLTKQFRFSRYDFLARSSSEVSSGSTSTWSLKTGESLDVRLDSAEGSGANTRYTLSLEVYYVDNRGKRQSEFRTQVRLAKGGTFLLGLGEYQDLGGTMILAIKAQ